MMLLRLFRYGFCLAFLWFCILPGFARPIKLKSGHPLSYTVQPGDTLWDISAKFLNDPLDWPDLVYNNPHIKNPSKIYPGEVLELTLVDGDPALRVRAGGTIKLRPKVRATAIDDAIPTIPYNIIQPFLNETRVVSKDELMRAPYIVAHGGEHVVTGLGDKIYVEGIPTNTTITNFSIYRLGDPYVDPVTEETLGFAGIHIGEAQITRRTKPMTLIITQSNREVLNSDRLLATDNFRVNQEFTPHLPSSAIAGQIISVLDGVTQIGQYQVVVINKGTRDGLRTGDMLAVFKLGNTIQNPEKGRGKKPTIKLPNERAGEMMVFRVFDKVSYGLILHATEAIHLLDIVTNPNKT